MPLITFLSTAFWDATRAFMLLAVLSCFAGVVLGLSAFTNGTKNRRVRTGGIALVLSGNTLNVRKERPGVQGQVHNILSSTGRLLGGDHLMEY